MIFLMRFCFFTFLLLAASAAQPLSAQTSAQFVQGTCPVSISPEDGTVLCGSVSVPADTSHPESRSIALGVAVLKARDSKGDNAPILYVHGGPGSSAIRSLKRMSGSPLRQQRDIVLVDQRGSAYSEPFCTTLGRQFYDLLMSDVSQADHAKQLSEAMGACKVEALNQGISLEDYKTSIIATDMEAVRQALNIQRWNVWGVSYGTAVGMTMAHLFPDTTRSVVLDSVSLNVPDWRARTGVNFQSALARLFVLCESDKECSERFGDLEALYTKAERQLKVSPLKGRLAATGEPFALNAHDFTLTVHQMLYSPNSIRLLPLLFERVAEGDAQFAANLSAGMRGGIVRRAFSAHYAIDCQGRGLDGLQIMETDQLESQFPLTAFYYEVCQKLGLENSDPLTQPALQSQTPALILTGALDPITPPHTAMEAAADFSNHKLIELPRLGHAVTLGDKCAAQLMNDFLENLGGAELVDCSQHIPEIHFVNAVWVKPDILYRLEQGWSVPNLMWLGSLLTSIVGLILLVVLLFTNPVTGKVELAARFVAFVPASVAISLAAIAFGSTITNDRSLLLFGLPAYGDWVLPLLCFSAVVGIFSALFYIKRKRPRLLSAAHMGCGIALVSLVLLS